MRSNSTKTMTGVVSAVLAAALLAAPLPSWAEQQPLQQPLQQASCSEWPSRPPAHGPLERLPAVRTSDATAAVAALSSPRSDESQAAPRQASLSQWPSRPAQSVPASAAQSAPAGAASQAGSTSAAAAVRALSGGRAAGPHRPIGEPASGGFPPLPPDPSTSQQPFLPDLHSELFHHGGSYLYVPEGDRINVPEADRKPVFRLPEDTVPPEPFTLFSKFLGEGPISPADHMRWFGGPYIWHPQFVGYGKLHMFGAAYEQDAQRADLLGFQMEVELDLRLTGTERFHVQFRPVGDDGTGGSYYQFSDPEGYVDNSNGVPQRYWLEGELHSLLGPLVDPFVPNDINVVVGKFPFAIHNALLMNDEVVGVAISKNSLFVGDMANLNAQLLYAFNDVDTFANAEAQLVALHFSADWDRVFYEATLATASHDDDSSRDSHYGAISRTHMVGPMTFAGRALFKWGDKGGAGAGQLFALEANYGRDFAKNSLGVESAVFYCNGFAASNGWNSLGGGNFNRIRTAFEVNPLVRLAAGPATTDNVGLALGVQFIRRHLGESISPEFAYESPSGEAAWGFGVRYLRKVNPRSFIEVLGLVNYSDNARYEREGVFGNYTIRF